MTKALHIYIHVGDSKWNEQAHPRAENGQFGSGSSGKAAASAASLKGDELGDYTSMKELRQKALAYADRFIGKKYKNQATGNEITVTKTGVKHTIAGSADNLVRSIPAIPILLERAEMISRKPDKRGDPNILAVETYEAPLQMSGKTYRAILTVKQYQDGRRFYDHGLVE